MQCRILLADLDEVSRRCSATNDGWMKGCMARGILTEAQKYADHLAVPLQNLGRQLCS